MKKLVFLSFTLIAMAMLMNTGCKKKDDNNTAMTTLYFHLHTNIDTSEVDNYGDVYTTAAGRKISLNLAQLYISGIQLVKPDGSTYDIANVTILKNLDSEVYYVASIPAGSYKSVKFKVGVDAGTNNSLGNSSLPSVLNHPEMWFTNTATSGSLVFVNCQGLIDTTAAANGTVAQMQPFMYMIGTDAHYTQVSMPDHNPTYSFAENTPGYIHLIVDYSKLFNGVSLSNPNNLMIHTAADNATTIGNIVAGNIPSMFSYEE